MQGLSELPRDHTEFINWSWSQLEPYYNELSSRQLAHQNVDGWLGDWSRLNEIVSEIYQRLYVATTVNTMDADAEKRYRNFLDTIYPAWQAAEHKLKEKLVTSGFQPSGFELQLRDIQAEVEIFRKENLPLLAQERKLETEYSKIIGAQTVIWEGRELTIPQLLPIFQNPDRTVRERAWRLGVTRQLQDRQAINELWRRMLKLRLEIAHNAGFSDYRGFRWKQLVRFDYTPDDCKRFHEAIEKVLVPVATRIYENGRRRLGVDSLRPWDLRHAQGFGSVVDPAQPPLRPFSADSELKARCGSIFRNVDAQLGKYFEVMMNEQLLDLDNRKGKAPGGYCTSFEVAKRPFIFMNAVGLHRDVQTLLHESGHAFHVFESSHLPYAQQRGVRSEFSEVASMGMELLASPYISKNHGGFYSEVDAKRALREHLEESILFWPYMAVVDGFQHWVYENHEAAMDPKACDANWTRLWERFMFGVDWSGLEDVLETRWQRQLHIINLPFYYVEYGLAQLGAVQVWRNALENQQTAVRNYRRALSLGGTASLRDLYKSAGAKFSFEKETLQSAVELIERTIEQLDAV